MESIGDHQVGKAKGGRDGLPFLFLLVYMRLDLRARFLRTGVYRKGHSCTQVVCFHSDDGPREVLASDLESKLGL